MWTRPLLKSNAKAALRHGYWKVFLICLAASLLTDGLSSGLDVRSYNIAGQLFSVADSAPLGLLVAMLDILLPLGILLFLVMAALAFLWGILFAPVVETGKCRCMLINRSETPALSALFSGFGPSYWSIVKGMFYINLRIFLYSLLLVIPGVVKCYQYKFVPYLLAENPALGSARAAELSTLMSDGEKWSFFVLDLSFLGWYLLGILALGIGSLFVNPYYEATQAELYAAMRAKLLASGAVGEEELTGRAV